MLKQADAHACGKIVDLYHKYGMGDAAYCNFKTKYADFKVSQLTSMKAPEEESSV